MVFLFIFLLLSDYKMFRLIYIEVFFGLEVYKKVREIKVFVVGVGGIGCEFCGLVLVLCFLFDLECDLLNIKD